MAFIFMDGFDYMNMGNGANSQTARKWDNFHGNGYGTGTFAAYGQGQSIKNPFRHAKTFPANYSQIFCGFHVYTPQAYNDATVDGTNFMVSFNDNGTDKNHTQIAFGTDGTGAPCFVTGFGSGTVGAKAAPSFRLTPSTFYWLELNITFSPTVGAAELKINGVVALTLTGVNTSNSTSNAFFNIFELNNGIVGGGDIYFDDFHLWTNAGERPTGYIGEHSIYTKYGNAVGDFAQWTMGGSSIGANNFNQTNEHVFGTGADDDVSYVASGTAAQVDLYNFDDITQNAGDIAGIAINTMDRIDDATPRVIHHVTKSGATTSESADVVPSSTYMNHQTVRGVDPNTAAQWTIANFNAAQFGVKEIS